jgi:competence protein ComEA
MVKGIGLKTIEKNRDRIAFGHGAPAVKRPARPAARPAARAPARK